MSTEDLSRDTSSPSSPSSTGTTGVWRSTGSTAAVAEPVGPKLVTDRFLPSLGLLGLRLVVAVVTGVHAYQKFSDLDAAKQFFDSTPIFAPHQMAVVTAVGEALVALGCLFGVAVRGAGLGALLIGVGALVYVKWQGPVFTDNASGFAGEVELLLAGAGLALLALGGGAWGVDRWFRERNKRGLAAIRS